MYKGYETKPTCKHPNTGALWEGRKENGEVVSSGDDCKHGHLMSGGKMPSNTFEHCIRQNTTSNYCIRWYEISSFPAKYLCLMNEGKYI